MRIRSAFGPLYKLGFTTAETIAGRFEFKNNGDEKLLDVQFLFAYHESAFDLEARLHQHFDKNKAFGKYARYEHLPLYGNGQSELYGVDILGLDPDYTDAQGAGTMAALAKIGIGDTPTKYPWWVLVIAVPLKWFFRFCWQFLLLTEIFLEILCRVKPADRASLKRKIDNEKQAERQRKHDAARQESIDSLLAWTRSNRIREALLLDAGGSKSPSPIEKLTTDQCTNQNDLTRRELEVPARAAPAVWRTK